MDWVSKDSAALAWLGILTLIFLYVLAYDLWAHYSKHLTMTAQFRNWLGDPIAGPVIFALYVGIFVGLTFHFVVHGH
jgi:hypothetical protein